MTFLPEERIAQLLDVQELLAILEQVLRQVLAKSKPRPMARHTVYKSLGIAVEDVRVARLIYRKAQAFP
jgi:ornithine cyclodeaminase/alanine dehydrogenase-like protein (mu-crystallin family)